MNKTIIWLIVIIVVIAGIWWGVSRRPTEEEVIKIGAILDLSGPAVSDNLKIKKLLLLYAVKNILTLENSRITQFFFNSDKLIILCNSFGSGS